MTNLKEGMIDQQDGWATCKAIVAFWMQYYGL